MTEYIIFGGNGMLAYAFKNHTFFKSNMAPDVADCDITDLETLKRFMQNQKPKSL